MKIDREFFKMVYDFGIKRQNVSPFREGNVIDEYNIYKFIDTINENDFVIIKTPRQVGMTSLLATYCAILHEYNILYLSLRLDLGRYFLRDVERMYGGKLPSPNHSDRRSNVQLTMPNENGMKGRNCDVVIYDQAAFMKQLERIHYSIAPAIASGGKIIMTSTSNGSNNYFAQLYKDAVDGKNSYKAMDLILPFEENCTSRVDFLKKYGSFDSVQFRREILGEFADEKMSFKNINY